MATNPSSTFLEPPPAYDHMYESDDDRQAPSSAPSFREYSTYKASGKGLYSSANIAEDGRINVDMRLNKALPELPPGYANPVREFAVNPSVPLGASPREEDKIPRMSIVVMIVGSRGDVQPFVALGKELLKHGHRVRIATHETFRSFVKDAGLEFYGIGGDPHELMSYMVRNPGLVPGWTSLTNGDIGRKQKMLAEILDGCWNACSQPDIDQRPFIADAIISNPPAFAHIHCAEALGIPLQLSFTMPWSATTGFPHPLVNISHSNAEPGLTNYLTYGLAEMMTWQGLGSVINDFRTTRLGLEPLNVRSGPGIIDRLKVPWTYCFSPEIVPKPDDWQNHIDVVGFYFLDLASSYTPPADLVAFLEAGPPPVYIGFGSVVVEDPEKMTKIIFEATAKSGVRALVSAGWGGLGGTTIPPHVFILGNVPHDWLFTKVSAVCHHGGAGTTAIGLRLGKPTIIVPFFGDQPFWGAMVHHAGAGPKPIRPEKLDVERLSRSIEYCMTEEARIAADELGKKIRAQNGVKNGVDSFHQHLPILNMRCDLLPDELAVWWSPEHCLKLSAVAAQVLSEERLINIHKLEIHRPKEYDTWTKSRDPISGGVVETLRSVTSLSESIAQIFSAPKKGLINTTTAIPRSVMHILDSFADGLTHTPELYGSAIREPGRIKDAQSGMKEGGKAFFFGMSDGITGLVTEPVEGYKAGGWKGLAAGSMRSYVNAAVRPAAGALSLFAYPIRGAVMSLNRQDASMERHLRQLRVDQGKEAADDQNDMPSISSASSTGKHTPSSSSEDTEIDPDSDTKKKKSIKIRHREARFEKHLRSLHVAAPERVADSASRMKIIELFKVACEKESLRHRKKAMQKRVQWVITKGGTGSVTEMTPAEAVYFSGGQVTTTGPHKIQKKSEVGVGETASRRLQKRPETRSEENTSRRLQKKRPTHLRSPSQTSSVFSSSSNLPPPYPESPMRSPPYSRDSRSKWTEEDEEFFSRQLDLAIKLSSQEQPVLVESPTTSTSIQRSTDPVRPLVHVPEQTAPNYHAQLLDAAARWSEANDATNTIGAPPESLQQMELPKTA